MPFQLRTTYCTTTRGAPRARARHVCPRLETVLGCQLLVLGPEGVHTVDHLLDQLHLGVAQPVLVRDVVGHAYTIKRMINTVPMSIILTSCFSLDYKDSKERLNCAVYVTILPKFTVKLKFYEKAMTN
jgi:hypothetical protein